MRKIAESAIFFIRRLFVTQERYFFHASAFLWYESDILYTEEQRYRRYIAVMLEIPFQMYSVL